MTDIVVGWEPSDIQVEMAQYDIHVDLPSYSTDVTVEVTGPMGPRGQEGTPGTPGAPGSTILSGTSTPTGATGNEGDYYLDNDAAILYGPKAGSSWPIALQGVVKGTTPPTDLNAVWIDLN